MEILDEKVLSPPAIMDVDDAVTVQERQCKAKSFCGSSDLLIHSFLDEAFATKNMPELGHDVEDFKVFTWKLTRWKSLEKKITSPEFECGGHRWCCPKSFGV